MSNNLRKIKRAKYRHDTIQQQSRRTSAIKNALPIKASAPPRESDTRIAYGSRCTWWDSIWNVGSVTMPAKDFLAKPHRLPVCPNCKGVLMEFPNEEAFWKGSEKHEETRPGYIAMMKWMRGKCFPTMKAAAVAYFLETGIEFVVEEEKTQ